MALTPYATLGDLDLGVTDASGVKWTTKTLNWWSSPGSTLNAVQRPRGHGAWAGDAFLGPRRVEVSGSLRAPSEAAWSEAVDRLHVAASLYETVLMVAESDRTRWCNVRREDEVLVRRLSPTYAEWSVQLLATDPRMFGDSVTETTGLPSSSGGVTFPLTFPLTFSATTVTGQVTLTNVGNETGPLLIRIDGPSNPSDPPLVGPVVTHVASGLSLVFSTSLTLGYGEFITVDPEARQVLAQGQSSRSGWVTGRGWPGFEPGVNTYSFSAVGGSPSASMTVTGIPAWQ